MATEDLAADPVGPLADEFTERCRRGERPSVTEYAHTRSWSPDPAGLSMIMLMEKAGTSQDVEGSTGDALIRGKRLRRTDRGYRIPREIGQGGMEWFTRRDRRPGPARALKVPPSAWHGKATD